VLLRLLPVIVKTTGREAGKIQAVEYRKCLARIDKESLAEENIRAAQGSAGMKQIFELLKGQLGV
jgi:hypothetical protein